jgi:hypothetical protein
MLILAAVPNISIFLILNGWRYLKFKQLIDLVLLKTWVWLILTIGAYFLYFLSGLTERFWNQGIWFSANDVLHISLIIWMVFIARVVARNIRDHPAILKT